MKRLLLGLLAPALLAAGAFALSIDRIASRAAERAGREALGVDVSLGFVRLSLLAGGLGGLARLPVAVTGGVLEGAGDLVGEETGEALDAAGGAVRDAGSAVERGARKLFRLGEGGDEER